MPTKDKLPDTRYNSEENHPCLKEHFLSLKCLNENSKNTIQCSRFFENYRVCKAFWNDVYADRRRKGISPYLPPPDERANIKKEYLESQRNKYKQ